MSKTRVETNWWKHLEYLKQVSNYKQITSQTYDTGFIIEDVLTTKNTPGKSAYSSGNK